ncbi:MAG: hypothetical protein ACRDT2_08810 [Natronosporangium sp.]
MANTIQRAEDILDTAIAEQDLHQGNLDDPYRELLLTLALDVATAEADLRAETDTVRRVIDRVTVVLDKQPQLLSSLGELQGNGPRFDVRVAVLGARRRAR